MTMDGWMDGYTVLFEGSTHGSVDGGINIIPYSSHTKIKT